MPDRVLFQSSTTSSATEGYYGDIPNCGVALLGGNTASTQGNCPPSQDENSLPIATANSLLHASRGSGSKLTEGYVTVGTPVRELAD